MALGAGEEDLGTPKRECFPTTKPGLECLTLGIAEFSNEQRWFHDPLFGANHHSGK